MATLITRITKKNCEKLLGSPLKRLFKPQEESAPQGNLFFVIDTKPGVGGASNCSCKAIDKSRVWKAVSAGSLIFAVSPATFELKFSFQNLSIIRDDAPGTFTGDVTAACSLNVGNCEAMTVLLLDLAARTPDQMEWSISDLAGNIKSVYKEQICNDLRQKITDAKIKAFSLSNGVEELQLDIQACLPPFLNCSKHNVGCLYSDRPSSSEPVVALIEVLDPEDTPQASNEFERRYNAEVKKLNEEKLNLTLKEMQATLRQEAVAIDLKKAMARFNAEQIRLSLPPDGFKDMIGRLGSETLNTYYKKLHFAARHPILTLLSLPILFWFLWFVINAFVPLQYEIVYVNGNAGVDRYAVSVLHSEIESLSSGLKIPERSGNNMVSTDYKSRSATKELNKKIRNLIESEKHAGNYTFEIDSQLLKQTVRITCKGKETTLKVNIIGLNADSIGKIKHSLKKFGDVEESGTGDNLILAIDIRKAFIDRIADEIRQICKEFKAAAVSQRVENNTIKAIFRGNAVESYSICVAELRKNLRYEEFAEALKDINRIFDVNFNPMSQVNTMPCGFNARQGDDKIAELQNAGLKVENRNGVVYILPLPMKKAMQINIVGVATPEEINRVAAKIRQKDIKVKEISGTKIVLERDDTADVASVLENIIKTSGFKLLASSKNAITIQVVRQNKKTTLVNISGSTTPEEINTLVDKIRREGFKVKEISGKRIVFEHNDAADVALVLENIIKTTGFKLLAFSENSITVQAVRQIREITQVNISGSATPEEINTLVDKIRREGFKVNEISGKRIVFEHNEAADVALVLENIIKTTGFKLLAFSENAITVQAVRQVRKTTQVNISGGATPEEINKLTQRLRGTDIKVKKSSKTDLVLEHGDSIDVPAVMKKAEATTGLKVDSFTPNTVTLKTSRPKQYTISVQLNDEIEFKAIAALVKSEAQSKAPRYQLINSRHDRRSDKAVFVIETHESVSSAKSILHAHITKKFQDYELRNLLASEK